MKRLFWILLIALLALAPFVVLAQSDEVEEPDTEDSEDCPELVQSALQLTRNRCETLGRNQVCYGHSTLEAASRPGNQGFSFEVPGDIEDVIEMQSLSLSAMDTVLGVWGVILMEVQAGLDVVGQDVTFVLFGDTDLNVAVNVFDAQTTANVNVRDLPDREGEVIGILPGGEDVVVNGRSDDDNWLRVLLSDVSLDTGWIANALVVVDGEVEDLDVVSAVPDPDDALVSFGPMQAFYFESGDESAPCNEAPNSGMMIQTPEGAASVTLWIDEVIIELDETATAFVQAQADGELTVATLEGSARVTSLGETTTTVAGTQVSVQLNDELGADSAPGDLEELDTDNTQSLPVELLKREVEIPEPLTLEEGVPIPGNWSFAWGVDELTCDDGTIIPFESAGVPSPLTVQDGGATIVATDGGPYSRQSTGVYSRAYIDGEGNLYQETLNVLGPDSIAGEAIIDFSATICTLTVPFSLRLVSQ